ncbi:MAG: metallophosphoesterase [Coprobacillus sp.]
MSRILIISDTHFLRKNELESFFKQFNDIDSIIHCGDIYVNYQDNDFKNFYICKGNNDFGNIPKIQNFIIDNIRFTTIHGNQNYYAYEPLELKDLLEEYPADIICFGHSHVPFLHKEKGLMIINPGSLALARSFPRINSYAILDTQTKDIHFYNVKNNEEITIKSE